MPLPTPQHCSLTVDGNRLTLLTEGPARLEALLALIDGAEDSLRILYYIFMGDEAGGRVRDALMRAVDRGVAADRRLRQQQDPRHLFQGAPRQGRALLSLQPQLWPPLPAAQSPETRAGR